MVRHLVCFVLLGLLSTAADVRAQEDLRSDDRGLRFHGLGPRLGLAADPSQFIFGAQADFGDPSVIQSVCLCDMYAHFQYRFAIA